MDSVFVFNRITNAKVFLFQSTYSGRPFWGKNNWIIFEATGGHVYKIKPNGDSLTQLTFSGGNHNPIWNAGGTKFIYQSSTPGGSIICDVSGMPLDTLANVSQVISEWNNQDNISSGLYDLNYFNANTDTKTPLYTLVSGRGVITGSAWLNANEILWCYQLGIYKTNISNQATTCLKETCGSAYYYYPTYSPQINKVILTKYTETLVDSVTVKFKWRLVMMNPDGTGEENINIP